MTKKEVITQLESLKAESKYNYDTNPDDNEIWEKDIIALNRAIRAIEKRRLNVKKLTQLFVFITAVAAFFFVYIKVDSLYLGKISSGQALVFSIPALVYMLIAADTYKRLGRED
ncbi:hypothetical protein [Anaerocolumna sp.]|uniref:hypothetical protein n=1 Tax=Anaerocolumna sp. TaxID=2041569 RepID=UPI0028A8FC7C|nr:hypothetical protein [Anaerocolumna sp.]